MQIGNQNEGSRKVSSPSRTMAEEREEREARKGERCDREQPEKEEKESDDQLLLRIFDGNNSLRNQISRTAYVPKTASVEQIRARLGLPLSIRLT